MYQHCELIQISLESCNIQEGNAFWQNIFEQNTITGRNFGSHLLELEHTFVVPVPVELEPELNF
jgi:hypothetical protein